MNFRKLFILVSILLSTICIAMDMEKKIVSEIKTNNIFKIKLMLEKGLDPNTKTSDETPIFHIAVMEGKTQIVNLFLEHGVDVNIRDNRRITALMYACADGKIEIVKALLKRGAEVDCLGIWKVGMDSTGKYSDTYEETALMIACEWRHPEIVRLLLDSGANPNVKSNRGETALFFSVERRLLTVVPLLLKKGANPNIVGDDGRTILGIAVGTNLYKVCKLLIESGADVNIRHGEPLIWAVDGPTQDPRILKLLLESGCNVNINHGYALRHSTQIGSLVFVKLLLEHGAKMDIVGKDGKTALDIAVESGDTKIIEFMRKRLGSAHSS